MQLIKMIIKGCIGMSLKGEHTFTYTPQTKIQLILGTNGAGKSVLLSQIPPNPPNPNLYRLNGSRYQEYYHNGHIYETYCFFGGKGANTFSVKRDGIELNESLLVSMYKEIILKEFGLTQELTDLIMGNISFTSMDTAKRRSILLKLPKSDFKLAMKMYHNLKDYVRDLQGSLKFSQSKLTIESSKILDEQDKLKIENEIKDRQENQKLYLESGGGRLDKSIDELENSIDVILNLTNVCSKGVLTINNRISKNRDNRDLSRISQYLGEVSYIYNSKRKTVLELEQEVSRLESLTKNSDIKTDLDLQALKDKYETLTLEINKRIDNLDLLAYIKDPIEIHETISSMRKRISELLSDIETDPELKLNKAYLLSLIERINSIKETINSDTVELNKVRGIVAQLEHAREHNQTTCPKCEHNWIREFDEKTYNNNLKTVDNLIKYITENEEKIKSIEKIFESAKKTLLGIQNITLLLSSNPKLNKILEYVTNDPNFKINPRSILTVLDIWSQQSLQIVELNKLIKEQEETSEYIKAISIKQNEEYTALIGSYDSKMAQLSKELKEFKEIDRELRVVQSLVDDIEKSNKLSSELKQLIQRLRGVYDCTQDTYFKMSINELISQNDIEISKLQSMLSKTVSQQAIVNSIEQEIKDSKEVLEVAKLAMISMSPNEGIIAKSLYGFLNGFFSEINSFIGSIWSYPIVFKELSASGDGELNLDYKFQVRVADRLDVEDISLCSSGQKEVIDLAFRVISMKHLGFISYPLVLDELGAKMDNSHKASMFSTVVNILSQSYFSQVFMVNHYQESYGCISDVDVTILCPDNVVIPKGFSYNKAMTIH